MLEPTKITLQDKIYSDPTGTTSVHQGLYHRNAEVLNVAVKVLTIKSHEKQMEITQEMMLQAKLEDCPYICKLYGYFQKDGCIYIVMERLGDDLEKYLKQRNSAQQPFEEWELVNMLQEVLAALQYAQDKVRTM